MTARRRPAGQGSSTTWTAASSALAPAPAMPSSSAYVSFWRPSRRRGPTRAPGPRLVRAVQRVAVPLLGLLLGEPLVERLAVRLLPGRLAEVVRPRALRRGVALVEHVADAAVEQRVLGLELVVVALGARLRVRAGAGGVFAHTHTVAPPGGGRSTTGATRAGDGRP
ncbi:hypothetical protein BJF88_03220 [Cellulosimicrobium sp. CUA-896]|nr:hypothetical protein BJF88_03220 [Cellulosimicrobium sp. CUA-896]